VIRCIIPKVDVARAVLLLALFVASFGSVYAQPRIAALRPDAAAPGMSVMLEILAPASQTGAFGPDSLTPASTRVVLDDPKDSLRLIIGPLQVLWNGRLLQAPVFVLSDARTGPIPFHIVSPVGASLSDTFLIVAPQHLGTLSGDVVLGDGTPGFVTQGNTLVVDSLTLSSCIVRLSLRSADSQSANSRYQPLTILSKGPIRFAASEVRVSANGMDGGPGGGGGGHGHTGVGGAGFTGGGNSSDGPANNVGIGGAATDTTGGPSLTGVYGGESEKSDQGGGGGTGHPFGTSGRAGIGADTSRAGGLGAGSGGGEQAPQIRAYGGGGGAFGSAGLNGVGVGANGGRVVGGRFLVPLAGGSGGAAGNALNEAPDAGNGGGGGGAIALVTYDSLYLEDALITAAGDSGTSGASSLTAGGGGGSGGGVFIATARGAVARNFDVQVSGGAGGLGGGVQAGRGGNGGTGRLRVDGPIVTCSQCGPLQNVAQGISVYPDTAQHSSAFILVHGVPSAPQLSTDTVRIFYRTRHSAWQYVDTVRYVNNGQLQWSKWLPASHDSLLFVAAFSQVLAPDKSKFNYEPDWLPSPVSLSVMRHVASPFLVVTDSLWMGSVRRGHCTDRWLRIENKGEAPLRLDSTMLVGDGSLSVSGSFPRVVAPYSIDSVLVRFCPDSVGIHHATLSLFSNDSLRAVILAGEALERSDTLIVEPSLVELGRIRVGTCDSVEIRAFTTGSDTAYLFASSFESGSFKLRLIGNDTAIAPGDTARLWAYYCVSDSGLQSSNFALSERGDSLTIRFIGVLRRIVLRSNADSMNVCGLSPQNITDTLDNVGNDTETVFQVRSRQGNWVSSFATPASISPSRLIEWQSVGVAEGVSRDTIEYVFSDTVILRPLTLYRTVPALDIASSIIFDPLCVHTCDSLRIRFTNTSTDSLRVTASISGTFSASYSKTVVAGAVDSIAVNFCPPAEIAFRDTLIVHAARAECDSVFRIALYGVGTVSQIVLDTVRFDPLILGSCATDSLTISNPCGPEVTITDVSIAAPFVADRSGLPLTIPSRGKRRIAITFCAVSAQPTTSTLTLMAADGTSFGSFASGSGIDTAVVHPTLHITLKPVMVIAGESAPMLIVLDSSNLKGIHKLRGSITYDRLIAYPSRVSAPFVITDRLTDTLDIESDIDMERAGVLGTIDWIGLLGPSNRTDVLAGWQLDSVNDRFTSASSVEVIDCSGLAGAIRPGGAFALGQVFPSPVAQRASVAIQSLSEAPVTIILFDALGRVEKQWQTTLMKGAQILPIEVSDLPSGLHTIVLSSYGEREVRGIAVQH
jgi:hypothetical protein